MKKTNLKKMAAIALAGVILAGALGWNQMPVQAAVNGEPICMHDDADVGTRENEYVDRGFIGHMERIFEYEICPCCNYIVSIGFHYGPLEEHDYNEWRMIEDRGDGLYEFWIRCTTCGYEDEIASDDPNDPKL